MLYMEIMLCCCLNLSNFIGKNGPRAALSSYLSIALVITLILFTMFILMLVFAAIVFPYNDENHDIRAFKAKRDAKYHFRYIGEQ